MLKIIGITQGTSKKNNDATYMQLHCEDLGVVNPDHIGKAVEKLFIWTSSAGDSPFKQPVQVMGGSGTFKEICVGAYIKPFKESVNGLDVLTVIQVCDDKGNILPVPAAPVKK